MSQTTRDDQALDDRCDCDAMTSIPFVDTSCSIIEDLKKAQKGVVKTALLVLTSKTEKVSK